MRGDEQQIEVSPDLAGQRADVILSGFVGSRSKAQRLIAEGLVTSDGHPIQNRDRFGAGAILAIERPEQQKSDAVPSPSLDVVFEDDFLLVVNKPRGMVVHPAPGHGQGTLAQLLEGTAAGGEAQRAGLVHRLDKDTSGLLVVAKTEDVHRKLSVLIKDHLVEREYLALVMGAPQTLEGTIDAPIGRDAKRRTVVSLDSDRPRSAVTHFTVEEALADSTLLAVRLQTGRTHQIRVHLQAIGLPVAGDRTYGQADAFGLERQFLHARRLSFVHPITGERVDVSCELPLDLQAALEIARGGKSSDPDPNLDAIA